MDKIFCAIKAINAIYNYIVAMSLLAIICYSKETITGIM